MSKLMPALKNISPAAIEIIRGQAAILKLVDGIKVKGKALDKLMHQAALSVLVHHHEHGDITLVCRLLHSMPKSSRRNALQSWMLAFDGKLMVNTDKATKAEKPLVHNKEGSELDQAGAEAMPFWEFKAVEGTTDFDFNAYINGLNKGVNKAMEKATPEQRAKLEAVLAALA